MKKVLLSLIVLLTTLVVFPLTIYGDTLRIGLTRGFNNMASVNISNTHITVGRGFPDGSFVASRDLHSATGFVIQSQGGQITVSSGGTVQFTFVSGVEGGAQIIAPGDSIIRMNTESFRGAMEFAPRGGIFTAINVIDIEEYLYGVVPAEMPPTFHIEALKAQAIASRTFAVHSVTLGRHRQAGFDLCNTYCCQVYNGVNAEIEITTQAVRETSGLMMFYDDLPILASYFSSSGGNTDSSENVWVDALSYLRGVPEIAPEHEPMVWTRTFTWAQLTQAANNANANIGTVTGVSMDRVASGGRVQSLTFIGTNGRWVRTGEQVRTSFSSIGGSLPSRNFNINGFSPSSETVYITNGNVNNYGSLSDFQVITHTGTTSAFASLAEAYVYNGTDMTRYTANVAIITGGTGITVNGRGWGHGVGMSQRGAEGMARLGFDFMEILKHYYTGVTIQ